MEVHHHSHKPKNWKEYITEFIMLFAAVTLGFLAENLREHQIIEHRKDQNLMAMIDDLKQDSIEIEARINEYKNSFYVFEKIKDISLAYQNQKLNENVAVDSIVNTYSNAVFGFGLFINNASYKNTIASGSLSNIENFETKKLIAQYYEALYGKLVVNNKVLDDDVNEFMNKSFNYGYMDRSDTLYPGQTRTTKMQLEDFKSIPSLRNSILAPEFRLTVNKLESRCAYYLFIMQTAKELNNQLLIQLNKGVF